MALHYRLSQFRLPLIAAVIALAVVAVAAVWSWRALQRDALRDEALQLADAGEYERAEPLLQQVVSWYPDDPAAARALALAHTRPGMPVGLSEPHIDHWCAVAPDDPEAHRARMRMWTALGSREKALEDGLRALRLDPDDFELRATVASHLVLTGRQVEAQAELRRCLKSKPGDVELRFLLAESWRLQGETGAAMAALDTILRDHPDHPKSLLRRAELLNAQGHAEGYAEAIGLSRRLLAIPSASAEHFAVRYQLSHALNKTGQPQEAQRLLQVNRDIQNAENLLRDAQQQWENLDLGLQAARALLDVGRRQKAQELLQELAKRHKPDARLRRLFAESRMRRG